MKVKVFDIIKDGNQWKMIAENGQRASLVRKTKQDILSEYQRIAGYYPFSVVFIHRADGTVQSFKICNRNSLLKAG